MTYKASEIARTLNLQEPAFPDYNIDALLTDSRSVTYPENSLFFALLTPSGDGHRYLAELYSEGVRNFVVEKMPPLAAEFPLANFFVVPDTLKALQTIAREHRRRFSLPVIGITGSRGKTIVKEWLYQLLQPDYNIVRSPRSYNSQIGVPLSTWELDPNTTLGIFEAGISLPGEMTSLQSIIAPTVAIITNIGDEHHEGFPSKKAKCREKVELLRGCDCIIYNHDNDMIRETVGEAFISAKELAWSRTSPECPLYITSITPEGNGSTHIDYSYLLAPGSITIPFTSPSDIENAIHSLAAMLYLNRQPEVIANRMNRLTPVGTRLNVVEGVNGCLLIHDSYTADFNSLRPALDFMGRRATTSRTSTVILSDLMHETLPPAELYKATATLLRRKGVKRIIGIGSEISRHSRYFYGETSFYESTDDFLAAVSPSDFVDELILLKGAAPFHFEKISDILEARQHETVLEVNLDSVVHNYNIFRSRLRPSTGIVAMVKASGYGAGAYEVAKTMQSQGAAYLAVAVLDEGVDLREAGITMPIMVLNPKVVNYRALFSYHLEPEIYSFDMLDEIIREGEKCGITDYPVHIKLDTGMHRLGFLETDIPRVVATLAGQNVITPRSIFSHLAAADDPSMDDYTNEQFEIFHRSAELLQSGFNHKILRHILNSTGITRFPEHQCEMVRLGICLYGIPTMNDGSQGDLRPVSTLRTVIISIKEWEAGVTIGYNRRGVLKRHSKIATIPVGYADGIDRHLGNGHASFMVNGHRCPTVGNICMDICMIDVTDAPCSVGDSVEIFGNQIPAAELADTLDTIPYEILSSVSTRVKRIYYRE